VNYAAILEALRQATDFELFRLRAAIDRALADPHRVNATRRRVHRGQRVQYFDPRTNRVHDGLVLEMRNSTVIVQDAERTLHLQLDYAALNLDHADTVIRERGSVGLSRQEVAVGDDVGFQDRDGSQRRSIVQRLNDKTVTLDCDGHRWRVGYSLLHRMINADT
jgi:hypothetical protein